MVAMLHGLHIVKITRKTNDALEKAIKEINKRNLSVGWFESSKYEDGTPVAQVASQNEFGSPANNRPPRPFMRNAISENSTRWAKTSAKISKDILNGSNVLTSLNLLGVVVEADIKKSITSITAPALALSTINARKNRSSNKKPATTINKPLVDTGYMLATVTSEVN